MVFPSRHSCHAACAMRTAEISTVHHHPELAMMLRSFFERTGCSQWRNPPVADNNLWHETLHDHFGQYFAVDKVLYHEKTDHQDLIIFENAAFGRVMALDGWYKPANAMSLSIMR
jgi:hypothetical protein